MNLLDSLARLLVHPLYIHTHTSTIWFNWRSLRNTDVLTTPCDCTVCITTMCTYTLYGCDCISCCCYFLCILRLLFIEIRLSFIRTQIERVLNMYRAQKFSISHLRSLISDQKQKAPSIRHIRKFEYSFVASFDRFISIVCYVFCRAALARSARVLPIHTHTNIYIYIEYI